MDGGRGCVGGRGGERGFRGGGGGGGGGGRRGGRGGRGGGRGGWRGGGRGGGGGWRGGGGGRGWGGREGGGRGRGGGADWHERRSAEPTGETLALMGTRATESTAGIKHFMTEDGTGFSGVLKQRYSDFIVHEVDPNGDVCKGTDFPGLLRPIEVRRHPPPDPFAAPRPTPEPARAEEAALGVFEEVGGVKEGEGAEGEDEDAKRMRMEEEKEAQKKEEYDEAKKLAKQGADALTPVVGPEVALKVEQFVLEGVGIRGKDKRTLTLPTSDKTTRTQVYTLLKLYFSRYLLATTVEDPASNPAATQADESETTEGEAEAGAKTDAAKGTAEGGGGHDAKDTAGKEGNDEDGGSGQKPSGEATGGGHGDNAARGVGGQGPQKRKKTEDTEEEGDGAATKIAKTAAGEDKMTARNVEKAAENDGKGTAVAALKPTASRPKCVQLKMKPGWHRADGGYRRKRGDLDGGGGFGGRGFEGRNSWPTDRPEFCRFVLYKENSDTLGAVTRMCKHFRFSNKLVGYAGTKDKRGVTSQWCTVRRRTIEDLRLFNRPLGAYQGSIVLLGNFSYVDEPLKLGNLSGNRFGIVLRNLTLSNTTTKATANGDAVPSNGDAVPSNGAVCTPGEEGSKDESAIAATAEEAIVEAAAKLKEAIDRRCALVREHGFINYFGLQRFGTGGAPTSEVGLAMLKEDWGGAVRLIMRPRLGENEATHNSKVHFLKNPTDIQGTLRRLPYFMDAERNMMQALLKGGPNAHVDALKAVPKNLQLMYLHAFQSLLWNLAASERVKLYGRDGAVEGDLVFPKDAVIVEVDPTFADADTETGDTVGEASAHVGGGADEGEGEQEEQPEGTPAKKGSASLPPVHVVTKKDVEEGTFRLTDVVLPMPGSGVTYPSNGVKECYTRALEERGLTEACFSSSTQKMFHLGGAYRRLVQVPTDMQWEMKRYEDHTLHLINTDIDDLLDIEDARLNRENARKKKEEATAAAAATDADDPAKAEGEGAGKAAPDAMDVESAAATPGTKVDGLELSAGSQGRFHALCLHFTLPTAAYATMCLREITKQDTSTIFHTSLNTLAAGQHPGNSTNAAAAACDGAAAARDGAGAGAYAEAGSSIGASAVGAEERGMGEGKAKVSSPKGAIVKVGASFK